MRRKAEPETPPMFDVWDRLIAPALGEAEVRREKLRRALDHEHKAGRTKRSHGARKRWNINTQRIAEIGYIIRSRHDGPCDTDDAELYLQIALPHFIKFYPVTADLRIAVEAWTATLLPTLARARVVEMTEEAEAREWRFASPDEVARLLNVVLTERSNLGLRTIGAIDRTKAQRAEDRKAQNAAHQRTKRALNGATPRSKSKAATRPWEAKGVSRSTYFARQKAAAEAAFVTPVTEGRTDPSALVRSTYLAVTDQSDAAEQAGQGPARTAHPRRSVGADGPSPGAMMRAVPPGRAVPLPLPMAGVSEQHDMLDGLGEWRQVGALLIAYEGGPLPPQLARAVREALRVRTMTQGALAKQVGVSRPQIVNVLQGRFGLSRSAAANLMTWLAAA